MPRLLPMLCLAAAFAAAAPAALAADCDDRDRECIAKAMASHPVRGSAFWQGALDRPLHERIGPAPPALVEYLTLDNRVSGFAQRPRVAAPDAAFLQDLRQAIDHLPRRVWDLAEPVLAGILLVDDLGSTGFTSLVRDARGRPGSAWIVLDAGVLAGLRGNEWATWKENTPFRRDGLHRLQARVETDAADGRVAAIRYILLHEVGHVVGALRNVHPSWEEPAPATLDRYPFAQVSWVADGKGHVVPNDRSRFPQRADVVYYLGPKLSAADMPATYAALQKTAFPTLYGALNVGDDFAESFATYVHVVLMGKPWSIEIRGPMGAAASIGPCWGQPRCEAKERVLRALLGP